MDTIVALASGSQSSAIALVRISGPACGEVCKALTKQALPPAREASLRWIVDKENRKIDHALLTFFERDASYTGEDVIEISTHGGRVVPAAVISAALDTGLVRLADSGEFTKRAFISGRLDLAQAEGVRDIIEARSRRQLDQALVQYDGALSDQHERWRSSLLGVSAMMMAAIDFPDEGDIPQRVLDPAMDQIRSVRSEVERALSSRAAESVRSGYQVAIVGPPNAGKSSLLNRLAKREAAIVTDIPGTTRDLVEVEIELAGLPVRLTDTAGLRETGDVVEREGIRRALENAEGAHLRLWIRDCSNSAIQNKPEVLKLDDIEVWNKSDLVGGPGRTMVTPFLNTVVSTSAVSEDGVSDLLSILTDRVSMDTASEDAPIITQQRHRSALEDVVASLANAERQLTSAEAVELAAEDVRVACQSLSTITGRIDVEDVLGEIFSKFCVGK